LQQGAIDMSCLKVIKEKGLRLTPQRRLIIDILHNTHAHLTGEDIIRQVQTRMPGVNKSTIYRTLDMLEKAGCVFKSESGDHSIYHHDEEGHHHHLMCSRCGKTIECDDNIFQSAEGIIFKKYGFHVDFKHMVMNGLCGECRDKE
jgi:Fur family transcriptional regulator, ferric uptake regulator